jgi:hypothetical protein
MESGRDFNLIGTILGGGVNCLSLGSEEAGAAALHHRENRDE